MITKYRTGGYAKNPIETVTVERETEKSVWVNGRQCSKGSSWRGYHSSWDDAHDSLLGKAQAQLNTAKTRLNSAQSHFDDIKGLAEKEEAK